MPRRVPCCRRWELPRREKNRQWISVKNAIRSQHIESGALFVCWYVWEPPMCDVIGRFLGARRPEVCWFSSDTLLHRYYWALTCELRDRAMRLAPKLSHPAALSWLRGERVQGEPGWRRITHVPAPQTHTALDSLTLHDWQYREMPALADSGTITECEPLRVVRKSSSHVMLDSQFNTREFTVEYVNDLIRGFLKDQKGWTRPERISFSWHRT